MADVFIKSGNLDTETCKQEECQVNINKPTNTKIASKATKVGGGEAWNILPHGRQKEPTLDLRCLASRL